MKRFVLAPAAEGDLQRINYIAKDSTTAARRVIQEIRDKILWLSRNQGLGHFREDLPDPDLRAWSVYGYVIVYRVKTKPLAVVRVLGSAQDFARHGF